MVITCHYIDKDWILNNLVLDFIYFPGVHDGPSLAAVFTSSVDDIFALRHRKLAITADNASNNHTFAASLASADPAFEEGNLLGCFCHVLHLAATAAMSVLTCRISAVRNFITLVKRSTQKMEVVRGLCQAVQPPVKFKRPFLDVQTRWNSSFDMLECAYAMRRPLFLAAQEWKEPNFPGDGEWEEIMEVLRLLKPYKEASDIASGTSRSTLAHIIPLYHELMDWARDGMATNASPLMREAFSRAHAKLAKHYDRTSQATIIATALDPRLSYHYYRKRAHHGGVGVEDVRCMLRALLGPVIVAEDAPALQEVSTSSFSCYMVQERTYTADEEVDAYFAEPLVIKVIDPLAWWKAKESIYPRLARLAKDYLAIPGASAAAERAFSTGGLLISDLRHNLAADTIQAMVCLKSWGKLSLE
jgi:hypothetical protein